LLIFLFFAFYGLIFSSTPYHGGLATMFPEDGGYAPFLFGKVVDMLYFPLIDTNLPDGFPIWGGQRFQFFRPVFNISDTAISTGVITLLLFHRRIFKSKPGQEVELTAEGQTSHPESPTT
jgi:signal peptidase II